MESINKLTTEQINGGEKRPMICCEQMKINSRFSLFARKDEWKQLRENSWLMMFHGNIYVKIEYCPFCGLKLL